MRETAAENQSEKLGIAARPDWIVLGHSCNEHESTYWNDVFFDYSIWNIAPYFMPDPFSCVCMCPSLWINKMEGMVHSQVLKIMIFF